MPARKKNRGVHGTKKPNEWAQLPEDLRAVLMDQFLQNPFVGLISGNPFYDVLKKQQTMSIGSDIACCSF